MFFSLDRFDGDILYNGSPVSSSHIINIVPINKYLTTNYTPHNIILYTHDTIL